MFFIIFCIVIVQSSLTCDYYREELDCIHSKLTCRWNQNVCVYTEGLNFGCSLSLSFAACIQQTYYPDGTLAQCIFSGYCRKVEGVLQSCANNLSRSACLAVDDQYCLWNNSCQMISEEEAQNLSVDSVKLASVGVCRLRTDQACIYTQYIDVHQQGAHDILNINYKASLLTNDSNKYKEFMQIPGCLNVPDDIFTQLNCESAGLNQQGCQLIKSQSCIFKNNLCQQVSDIQQLKCSDNLNQNACLSVTMGKCSWNNNKCIEIESKNTCSYDIQVSPGVCSNELNIECFYDQDTHKCNSMCRSVQMMKTETGCKQSSYNCKWENETCVFDSQNQCGKIGQNKYSCMIANQQCRFINGQCEVVQSQTSLDQLKCISGLNQISCLNINNPSQVCQFSSQQCQLLQITPDDICDSLLNVNPNACRKVTTQACYWYNGNCNITDGSLECETKGLNRIGCLSSTLNSCKWNEFSGVCEQIIITRIDKCDKQSLVNPVACRKIKGENCKYNDASNSCESFVMDTTVTCDAQGLNENGCANITNTALSCRWVSNQCITVESLGGAVSCSALQSVTYRTCAYVQQSKCQYDSTIQGCITSVAVTSECTTQGLNSYACASLSKSCYFDNDNKQCKVAADLSQITCDTMYPSQTTCLAITKQGQYCLWNSIDTICQLQTFPVSQPCNNYTLVNKLFCLAYEISITKRLSYTNNYCQYQSNSCVSFSTKQNDCGSTLNINLHACVGLSNQTKNCYFDSTTLKCLELQNLSDPMMTKLQCKQCGKMLCSQITTQGQNCIWNVDAVQQGDDKCMPVDTVDNCDKYTTSSVNPNVCASTQGQACKHVIDKCVVTTETNLDCSTSGLNQQGCLNNTQSSCVFDKNSFCQQVTDNLAPRVSCNDSVNKGGCLDSLMETCFWDQNKCNKATIDSTITCSQLNDKLYNAIVCASVTNGDKCKYNATTHHCEVVSATTDCKTGYNQSACSIDLCDFKQNVCTTRAAPQQNDCMPKTSLSDCANVTTAPCSWNGSKCNIISDVSTCVNVIATGQQNIKACQMVSKDACAYNSGTNKCVSVITNNNACSLQGLNQIGCIQKTKGSLCRFTNICQVSPNNSACSANLNADACASVTGFACAFDQSAQTCSQISDSDLTNFSCSAYSDPSQYIVNSLVCKYANTSSTCIYDAINQVCKVDVTILSTCNQNSTINQQYCLNYVRETCQFTNYTCSSMTNFSYDCNQAVSFRQCVISHNESCQWQNNQCTKISFSQDCITISNSNSIACMQNNYQSQQCQFKDNGMSTQCIVPLNSTSQCEGLNKLACLNNTAHACYYFDYCIDIQLVPYTAECKTGFYFTQTACVLIQNTTQQCMLNNGDCVSVNVTGSCSTYSSNVYSTQVCASVTSESCYWNHGCVQGVAANCSTLGANSLACKGATTGNCIFTNKCLDVLVDDISQSKCSDPSNQNGCLNLYNGQTCQWINNTCTNVSVTTGCLSYSQVNPGVCSAVTDVPCIWNSNSCAVVSIISNTCARGMNLLACVNYTSDICQFTSGMCKQITDITSIECSANLNKNACISHSTKCCQWQNNTCVDGIAASTCNLMSANYSKYCCMIQIGDKCTYTTTCTQLADQNSRCQAALNKTACLWVSQPCQWDNNQCSPVPNTIGCVDNINPAACIMQSLFCMYDLTNYKCIDGENVSCSALQYSSKGRDCTQVTDVGCQEGQLYGCQLTTISTDCQSKVNQIGCQDNIQLCQWDSGTCKTSQQPQQQPPQQQNTNTYINCPNTNISRGLCAQYTQICALDSNYSCIILDTDKIGNYRCAELNSISNDNFYLCAKISVEICQYYPDELRCGTTIKSHTCDTQQIVTNQLGCLYIQKDCIWNDKSGCEDLPENTEFYDCESITSQYTCLHYKSTACFWDNVISACKDYDANRYLKCVNLIDSVTSPGVCYYHSTDPCAHNGTTCYEDNGTGNCSNSKSPLGCQNNDTQCYWDIDQAICQQLILSEVPNMSCPQLRYSKQVYCTQPINEGQTCHWTNNLCMNANAQQVTCTSELSLYGCLAVAKENEQCIFTNNKCQYTNNTTTQCTNRLNIYGCVNVKQEGQFCKWLGQQCSTLTDTNFEIDKHILINQHVCRRVTNTAAKFDTSNYICIESQDDLCDTPGINMLGCLLTINAQCDWVNDKCVEYDQTIQFSTCEQYITVSPKVCSSITVSGLSCYHNSKTFSCQTFNEANFDFNNDVKTLNRQACLNITITPTIWNGMCQANNIIKGVTQCNELQNVNPVSCALIDVDDQICKYDTDGQCTTQFDSSIDQCDTLGLNILGCIAIENNKCQFANNKCQYYQGSINICTNLINVNSNVCQSLTTQPCKWNYVNRGCINIYKDKCDVDGINQLGCQSLSNCTYILNQCICNGLIQLYSIIDCTQYTQENCYQDQCIYDIDNNNCRNKICNDINIELCDQTTINQYQCYRSQLQCKQAKQCSDLFKVADCKNYKINGKQCNKDPYYSNHCIDQNCKHFTQDECSGDCMWSYYQCEQKSCTYLKKTECTGIVNNQQCFYKDQCIAINSCEEYMSYIDSEQSQETQCNQQKILNKQCYWLSNQCISSLCRQFGLSSKNCNGTEVNSEVCVLFNNQCQSCNEIEDPCTCMNQSDYCYYNKITGCQSNTCAGMSESQCSSGRCVYKENQFVRNNVQIKNN